MCPAFVVAADELPTCRTLPNVMYLDWEAGGFPVLRFGTGNDEVVKSTAQVVYEISDHGDDHWICLIEGDSVSPALGLFLRWGDTHNFIRAALGVISRCVANLYHVPLRPFEFDPPGSSHELQSTYDERRPAK